MITLAEVEQQIKEALKSKDNLRLQTLRGIKTRIQNEQIAKGTELSAEDIIKLLRSEQKRRHEAASSYSTGGRPELAEKEQAEAKIIEEFLPEQISESVIAEEADKVISEQNFTSQQFGAAMAKLKEKFGDQADGATLAKILKEKLK